MSYTIGSFNMYKWGEKSSKNLLKLVEIIKDNHLDIVAFQEVYNADQIEELCKWLRTWDYKFGVPSGSPKSEGYAYIWNTRKFHLSETRNGKPNPVIVEKYRIENDIEISGIRRPPYYIKLTSNILDRFEIRLINVHLRHNKVVTDTPSRLEQRYQEYKIIAESILKRISNEPEMNKSFVAVMLGDYNMTKSQIDSRNIVIGYGNDTGSKIINLQDEYTTLSNNEQNPNEIYSTNDYDHFTFNEKNIETIKQFSVERIDAVKDFYANERDKYKSELSDHVPIKITVDIK